MLRIYRCSKQEVSPQVLAYAPHAAMWDREIEMQLGQEYSAILAQPVVDGDYVNFLTPKSGEQIEVDSSNLNQFSKASELLERRKEHVYSFLTSGKPLINKTLESSRADYAYAVAHAEKFFVLQNEIPVAVGATLSAKPAWINPIPAAAAIPPKKGCLLPFLLLLLLGLLLLGLLWWFFLRPWPMEGTLKDRFDDLFGNRTEQVVEPENKAPQEEAKEPVVEPPAPEAKEDEEKKALEEKLKEEEAKRLALEEELKAKKEAEEKAEQERLAQEELKKKKEQEARELAAKKKAEEAKKKAEEEKKKAQAKKVPKCKTLKEQGKMPQMAIAFDGSESMQMKYGSTTRLRAAKSAAKDLISTVDKNVSIGLVEINGCPLSKNRGFFAPARRSALLTSIDNINPYAYDGKTPLVNGLNELSKMLDGKNSDAVGILISDGEDTCPFTSKMNVCTVAQKIHERQPKLKIHTILIGDSIDSAACIARNTGGQVFKPRDAKQIETFLKQAGASLKKVCEE